MLIASSATNNPVIIANVATLPKPPINVGIIGTGFIGGGLYKTIATLQDMRVSKVLTKRPLDHFSDSSKYTQSVDELIASSDLVVECNGDPVYATDILERVMGAGLPVVTMDAELQITTGTYLRTLGLIAEAEGDQPGTLAALHRNSVSMGFKPLVYGNLKGFLNLNPTPEEMRYWADRQGISMEQVTGFTDGTKVQIEQVLVANGLGAKIARQGLLGIESLDIEAGAIELAERAIALGHPISDYLLCSPNAPKKFPAGVFLTAMYSSDQAPALRYLKLGDGPYYTLIHNFHLCHLEIPKTIRQVYHQQDVQLDNGRKPSASVAAITKSDLAAGTVLRRLDRNFLIRGLAVKIAELPNHVPIGLLDKVRLKHALPKDHILTFDDVEIPDTLALKAWQYSLKTE